MVKVDGLSFSYPSGNFQLSIPHWTVQQGEQVAIIGPSGSGKTTCINLLSGILIPTKGSIHVDGVDVATLSDTARRKFRATHIGLVFQDFELVEYLNVQENIWYPYYLTRALAKQKPSKQQVEALLEQLGIGGKAAQPIQHLSQGEKQRVAIARALSAKPNLILADEPTGSLDPANKEGILKLLFDYGKQENATMLMVTHDHSLLNHFDRVQSFEDWRV